MAASGGVAASCAPLAACRSDGSPQAKTALAHALEREIRYLGSAEIAYACRRLRGKVEPAGVSINDVIADVGKRLHVRQKLLGSPEAKIERLVKSAADRTFFSMTAQQQREFFDKAGIGKDRQNAFFEKISTLLGPKVGAGILQGLAVATLAAVLGRQAAEELLKRLLTRFRWWPNGSGRSCGA